MKTYKELMERAFSERGQAAREKMRSQEGLNAARKAADRQQQAAKVGVTPPSQQKALPPGKGTLAKTPTQAATSTVPKKGGPLSTRAADKGGSLVKQKSAGDNSNKMGRTPNPYRYGQPPDGPQSRPTKPKKNKKNKGPSTLQRAGNFLKKGLNNTVGDGQPESSSGSIDAPKRGVYNG